MNNAAATTPDSYRCEPRAINAILLDGEPHSDFAELLGTTWKSLRFFTAGESTAGFSLSQADNSPVDLADFLAATDITILLTSSCEKEALAAAIGKTLHDHQRQLTVFILDNGRADDNVINHFLKAVRPYSSMLIRSRDEDYIESMLSALRA